MCGIVGIVSQRNRESREDYVSKMLKTIEHRGPDGSGIFSVDTEQLGLTFGHRRLSILDLSSAGAQPFQIEQYSITFNGEIYNYLEVRNILKHRGVIFKTQSDTEVLLAAYIEFGERCLDYFDGMFAFAIWDPFKNIVFLARDRFGEKPLYYLQNKDMFIFASEIKALKVLGIPVMTDPKMIHSYLFGGKIHDDMDLSKTFFTNIKQLQAGHYAILSDSQLKCFNYWKLESTVSTITYNDAVNRFLELLTTSLKRRMRSDVPIGTSLSGGLDSSVIASLINKSRDVNFATFSAKFPGFAKDESKYIEYVRNGIFSTNFDIIPSEKDINSSLKSVLSIQDEPVLSPSMVVQDLVMRCARQNGVKVLLDGQGADEILGGYTGFIDTRVLELLSTLSVKSAGKFILDFLRFNNGNEVNSNFSRMKKMAAKTFIGIGNIQRIQGIMLETRIKNKTLLDFLREYQVDYSIKPHNSLKEHLEYDLIRGGLVDLLRFADRNSMANSVEVRLPYLNHELVEFLFSLNAAHFIKNGRTKSILRDASVDFLDSRVLYRKEKIGYEPPSYDWKAQHDYDAIYDKNVDFRLANLALLNLSLT